MFGTPTKARSELFRLTAQGDTPLFARSPTSNDGSIPRKAIQWRYAPCAVSTME